VFRKNYHIFTEYRKSEIAVTFTHYTVIVMCGQPGLSSYIDTALNNTTQTKKTYNRIGMLTHTCHYPSCDILTSGSNKAVMDRRLRPRCCHLGSCFKRPKSSPVRPSACNWYYCAQFIAKPNAACALRFSWVATSSNLGL